MTAGADLRETLEQLAWREPLTQSQAAAAARALMSGSVSAEQAAALLLALRVNGETVDELVGFAGVMRELVVAVPVPDPEDLVDTAGTGGGPSTFNVSTLAALIAAGAGCRVAKHGNRSSTSRSGSADVLEALGVTITAPPERVAECIDKVGFGFMFAPAFHAAMRHIAPVRRALGVATIFNLVGPLTNPASARRQVIGVSDGARIELMAAGVARLGAARALVVRSADGLDELSLAGDSRVIEIVDGEIVRDMTVGPGDFGLPRRSLDEVAGGTPEENARTLRRVLAGESGGARDIAVLNAAAAIHVAGRSGSLAHAAALAQESLDSGAAAAVLDGLITHSSEGVAA